MSPVTRDVAGILHFLTPQQMAEEIVRLDALLAERVQQIPVDRLPAVMADDAWTCGRCGFRGFWSGGPHCGL